MSKLGTLAAISLLFAALDPTSVRADTGQSETPELRDPTTYFYLDADPSRVPEIVKLLSLEKIKSDRNTRPPMIGLLSSIFRQFPGRARSWAEMAEGRVAKGIVLQALWYAERQQDARDVLAKWGFPPKSVAWLEQRPSSPLRFKIFTPDHLDILWGAFFGSGDIRYVRKIVEAVQAANDHQQIDLEDVILTAEKIDGKEPRVREIGDKYMKIGQPVFRDYLMGAIALWALGSNATQHEIIGKYVDENYAHNPRDTVAIALKRLAFKHRYKQPVEIKKSGELGVMFAVSPRREDAEILSDFKRPGRPTQVTNTLKHRTPFYSINLFLIPAGTGLQYQISLQGPRDTKLIAVSPQIVPKSESRLTRFVNKVRPADIEEPGFYTLLLTATSTNGDNVEIAKQLFIY